MERWRALVPDDGPRRSSASPRPGTRGGRSAALLPARRTDRSSGAVEDGHGPDALTFVALLATPRTPAALQTLFAQCREHLGRWRCGSAGDLSVLRRRRPDSSTSSRTAGGAWPAISAAAPGPSRSSRCPFCGVDRAQHLVRLEPEEAREEGYVGVGLSSECRAYVKELDRRVRWNGGPRPGRGLGLAALRSRRPPRGVLEAAHASARARPPRVTARAVIRRRVFRLSAPRSPGRGGAPPTRAPRDLVRSARACRRSHRGGSGTTARCEPYRRAGRLRKKIGSDGDWGSYSVRSPKAFTVIHATAIPPAETTRARSEASVGRDSMWSSRAP